VKVPDQQGPVPMGGSTSPVSDELAQVEVTTVDALPCVDGFRVNEGEPQLKDAFGGQASGPGSPRGLGTHPPGDATPGDVIPAPRVLRHCGHRG
jgi:hypothetical protein